MASDFLQGPDLDIPDIKVKYESPQSLKELEDVVKMKMTRTGSSQDDVVKMKMTQTGSHQDDGVKMFCGESVKPGVGPGVLIGQLTIYKTEFWFMKLILRRD